MPDPADLSPDTRLDTRAGLPEALRVLVTQFPRETWAEHAHFHGLVSFWLERHMMFRRMMDHMRRDTQAMLDGRLDPQRYRQQTGRIGGMFVGELHGHHGIEDQHYFPVLAATDAKVARGFQILDADHHALDGLLDRFVAQANTMLQADPVALHSATGRFLSEITTLQSLLDRHLLDEEDLVVPVILKHGPGGLG